MANNLLLQLAGALLLGALAFEVFITAMTMRGSGPLTGALARVFWNRLLATHRIRPRHALLSFAGGAIAAMTLMLWVLALWMGWGLIFAGAPGAIVDVQSGLGADLPSRFYFAGFNIFTLGVGDFRPVGALWQFMTVLASASGLVAVTLAITYLLPILSQAVSRQALAGRIGLFGDTPAQIAANAWSQGLQAHAGRLEGLAPDILQQGRQHLAYPVLHYFHTSDPRLALPLRLAVLHEGLLMIIHGLRSRNLATPPQYSALLEAVGLFVDSIHRDILSRETAAPEAPPVPSLAEVGVPAASPGDFEKAVGQYRDRRRLLQGFLEHDGWTWTDVHRSAADT